MLRVLVLVDHARGISGPHRNVVGSLNALSRRTDVHVRLLCREIDSTEPYAHSPQLEIRLGYDPGNKSAFLKNVKAVRAAAHDRDVIYVPTGLKALLYAQAGRGARRLVAGPNVSPLPGSRIDSPGKPELDFLSDCWLEASASRRDHVVQCTGDARVKVIRHAIDSSKWSPQRADAGLWSRLGVPADSVKVVLVSRDNEPRKGVSQLLDAFALVERSAKTPVHLVIAGSLSETNKSRLSQLRSVRELGFVGPDDLPALYASADISVVPSSWENFPFVVMESMSSGIATIAPRVGGIPEQIVDRESGILVDIADEKSIHLPDAHERLAAAILELAEDEGLRKRLGEGARRRILEYFSEERLGRELMEVFQNDLA